MSPRSSGRRLNQREFRPMAEVAFRPTRQLSEYKGKGASASREGFRDLMTPPCSSFSQYTTLPKISTVCASKDVS